MKTNGNQPTVPAPRAPEPATGPARTIDAARIAAQRPEVAAVLRRIHRL